MVIDYVGAMRQTQSTLGQTKINTLWLTEQDNWRLHFIDLFIIKYNKQRSQGSVYFNLLQCVVILGINLN